MSRRGNNVPPTMDHILARCVEDGECLIWQGATNKSGTPQMRNLGVMDGVRRVVARLHGRTIVAGRIAIADCGHQLCVANAHVKLLRWDEFSVIAGKKSAANPAAKAARTAARRARPDVVLSLEKAAEIRASTETNAQLQKKYKCAPETIRAVRIGKHWVDTVQVASVFSWRPQ